jgi:hypothetical protein
LLLPNQRFVYDPTYIPADNHHVHLYRVETNEYAQYSVTQIKPQLQTITNSADGQQAIDRCGSMIFPKPVCPNRTPYASIYPSSATIHWHSARRDQ